MSATMTMTRKLAVLLVMAIATWSGLAARAGTITYFHNDLSGSPVAATNAAGQVIWRESYRPYGERTVNSAAANDNKVWFTSRRQDQDTGLVYMGARYYDPVVGRFMSMDPVGFSDENVHSHNRYAYANNNPYKYVDPDGKWGFLINVAQRVATFLLTRGPQASVAAAEIGAGEAIGGGTLTGGVIAREIVLSRKAQGEAAKHADDAIRAGHPDILTIDRPGAPANRQASTGSLEKVPNKHLDEYPPAMFKEGGAGASVRPISPRDNMSAGACIGNACRDLPNGVKVRIAIGE